MHGSMSAAGGNQASRASTRRTAQAPPADPTLTPRLAASCSPWFGDERIRSASSADHRLPAARPNSPSRWTGLTTPARDSHLDRGGRHAHVSLTLARGAPSLSSTADRDILSGVAAKSLFTTGEGECGSESPTTESAPENSHANAHADRRPARGTSEHKPRLNNEPTRCTHPPLNLRVEPRDDALGPVHRCAAATDNSRFEPQPTHGITADPQLQLHVASLRARHVDLQTA
jgi:hypothetical protein